MLCLCFVFFVNAQSQFGVLGYTVPEGWVAKPVGEDMEIVKRGEENSGCKITLFRQINTPVTTEKKFTELWTAKAKNRGTAIHKASSPVIVTEDGWVSIAASVSSTASSYTESFYTLCDSSITVVILTQATSAACVKEIKNIMATFNIPVMVTNSKTRAKTKKTKFPYVYR